MYIGIQGVQIGRMAGAAGATMLPLQIGHAAVLPQPNATQRNQAAAVMAWPAAQTINASAVVVFNSLSAVREQASDGVVPKQPLSDSMNATAEDLWKLAARFLSAPDVFTVQLTGRKATTEPALVQAAKSNGADTPDASAKAQKKDPSEAATSEPAKAKTKVNVGASPLGDGIEIEEVSLKLPNPPKASAAVSTGKVPAETAPQQDAQLKNYAVAEASGPFESVVPYSVSHLERARTILRAAKTIPESKNIVPFTRGKPSPAISRNTPTVKTDSNVKYAFENSSPIDRVTRSARTFTRSRAVGKSPAVLVGNVEPKKVHKEETAQIVRIAISGKASRRIVFSRKRETRNEYRFKGIDRNRGEREVGILAAQHALAAPNAGHHPQPTVVNMTPPAGGETAYTMPDPRELRADERQVLMSMLKEQLSLGPASLSDPKIRERFNGFMFSNTVGEMSHYVTADQWNAMVRATILYAARAVLPFSNNSITSTAAEYLFDTVDAEQRYDEWMNHFGISGLRDTALVDTFADENRLLTMPEYFLKGIMDYLADLAPIMHAYDEEIMPFPFTTELSLQWETIGFIHDPEISNDDELISAATAFAEEIAALDVGAARHFVELVLLSTRVSTDSIQGVWSDEQAVAFLASSIQAGLSDVLDPIGRNSTLPRHVRRLLAKAKQANNAQEDRYELGLELLTENLADAVQSGAFSIEMDEDELRPN